MPSSTVRKRGLKITSASKRSKLEDKLDEVVSLLRTQRTAGPTVSPDESLIPTPDSSIPPAAAAVDHYAVSERMSGRQLADFRDNHLPCFPFMYLPDNVSTDYIQLHYPILCLAIRVVCTKAITQQSPLSKQLREILASKIIVYGERNMDLLLSLIISIAW
jgi:hypothetical protein